jgi:subfamily B ATP-binding cassette protein MsbA
MQRSTDASHRLYLRLLGHVRPYWKPFAVGIFFMVLLALTEAGIPALLKPVLDGTFVEKDTTYLRWAPLAIIALFLVRGTASLLSELAFAEVSTRVVFDLRKQMFDRLLVMPTRYYDSYTTGTLLSKITYDVNQVTNAGTSVITIAVKDSLTVLALIAYIFWLDWQLALFIFILIPIVAAVAIVVGKRLRKLSRLLQGAQGDMTHILEESLRGHKSVKIFGGQRYERSRFEKQSNWVRRLRMKSALAGAVSVPVVELVGACIMAAVIYIGTARAVEDQLSVGGFVAFFAALGLLFSPIKRLTRINTPLQRGLAAAESIFGVLDQEGEWDTGTREWPDPRGHVVFEDVTFRYPGAEQDTLHGINVDIAPGSTVALVGTSGSGKTTLAGLIPRLHNPAAGRILVDGIDIRELPLATLRDHIALVSQDIVLFNDTVRANIAYGLTPAPDDERVIEAARAAHAEEFVRELPEQYDTVVGENGVRLSGGQRQRIAIARAVLKDAPILILDEATSALDNESERLVQQALETLRRGRTTLVIAHRLTTIEGADRILVMEDGRIVEDGDHVSLLAHNGRYAALYQSDFQE